MQARNTTLRQRNQIRISSFKGANTIESYNTSATRASYIRNFYNDNGMLTKRNGWFDFANLGGKINGVFHFKNNERDEYIIHSGVDFYRVYNLEELIVTGEANKEKITNGLAITDTPSQSFFNKGKMYIIGCGDFLVYGKWSNNEYELRSVYDNEDVYIPTTTISINPIHDTTATRASLDGVNLLTNKRINTLLGVDIVGGTVISYKLDAPIKVGTNIIIEMDIFYEGQIKHLSIEKIFEVDEQNKMQINPVDIAPFDFYIMIFKYGQIDFLSTHDAKLQPPISNEDNIKVTYVADIDQDADILSKCQFGTLFGADGNTDRLFMSGNPKYPNVDFYSQEDNYDYFPDTNTAVLGSTFSAIKGYSRLSDSTLAIFKEDNGNEPTIYFRTGKYDTINDDFVGIFPSKAGALGESCISHLGCANLNGDNLMVSRNGVFGIVIGNNVATDERYAKERSVLINNELKKYDLSKAIGYAFGSKYYLAVDDLCFVADSKDKFVPEGSVDGSFNYEWYIWDNMPVSCWFTCKDRLAFGTSDGRLCVFGDNYLDIQRVKIQEAVGAFSWEKNSNLVTKADCLFIEDGETIIFDGVYSIYALGNILSYEKTDDGYKFAVNNIKGIVEGDEVYVCGIVDDIELLEPIKYTVCDFDKGYMTFYIRSEIMTLQQITYKDIYLVKRLNNEHLLAYNSGEKIEIFFKNSGLPCCLSTLYTEDLKVYVLTQKDPVNAIWVSQYLDFGTNTHNKTLISMTVSTEASTNGRLDFGITTRKGSDLSFDVKGQGWFDFNFLDFDNFSFEAEFAKSHSVRLNRRNINYAKILLKSNNEYPCKVNDFTIIYKLLNANRGVK